MYMSLTHHRHSQPRPTSTVSRQWLAQPAFSAARPAGHLRRGNAMIMAVSLTVLLAIIGTSFVLVTRMDRQSVRGVEAAVLADEAVESVTATIQRLLAGDMFNGSNLKPYLYDYAGVNTAVAPADPWLASIEPVTRGNGYVWPQISELYGDHSEGYPAALMPPPTTGFIAGGPADADGDNVRDSRWREVPGLSTSNNLVLAAVRIIDNCGLVNVTTAWQRFGGDSLKARANDPSSFGEFLHQIDLRRLLMRAGVPDPYSSAYTAMHQMLGQQVLTVDETDPATGYGYDVQSALFQDVLIRDYGWFGLFNLLRNGTGPLQPYGLMDELELRNRFVINTPVITPLETSMWEAIGIHSYMDPTGGSAQDAPNGSYRLLPYTSDVGRWYRQLTNTLTPEEVNAKIRASQRHLITTRSFDRDIRPPLAASTPTPEQIQALAYLDNRTNSGLGKFRRVNVNRVLEIWHHLDPAVDQAQRDQAVRRLAHALELSGYTRDQSFQLVANLIDYVDRGSSFEYPDAALPTVFPSAVFGTTRDIYGTEKQPVITEVYNEVSGGTSTKSAVELYNPYSTPIELTGWQLRFGKLADTAWTINLMETIGPGERLVYVRDASGSLKTQIETSGGRAVLPAQNPEVANLTFSPANSGDGYQLMLVRAGVLSRYNGTLHDILIDRVHSSVMASIMEGEEDRQYSVWRALHDPNAIPPVAPWACFRNRFGAPADTHYLGVLDKPLTAVLDRSGIPIMVSDRGPLVDTTLDTHPIWASTTPGVDPLPPIMWRANWQDLGYILLIGNPNVNALLADTTGTVHTITDASADAGEQWNDNGNDQVDAGEWQDRNNNGTFDKYYLHEPLFRLNLTDVDRKVTEWISFFSHTQDGIDNDNSDGDSTGDPATDQGMYTGADDLLECRLPGRINVNTAPESVLKAIFPPLVPYVFDTSTNPPTIIDQPLTPEELDKISTWFAKAIIFLRSKPHDPDTDSINRGGAFISLQDLFDRLDRFNNPKVNSQLEHDPINGTPVLPDLPSGDDVPGLRGLLRFGTMVDLARGNSPGTTLVGDWRTSDNFEERDWIFTRMVNLLTVRSDTFTAYIAIRVQNRNNNGDFIERRYIALFDRSNVFLPEAAARNGFPLDASNMPVLGDDSGEMLIFDPTGSAYGPGAPQEDPNYFDRQYVTPRLVALQQVPDPR